MPDPLTAIRAPNDIDLPEDVAWSIVEIRKWTATPELMSALVEVARNVHDPKHIDWYSRKPLTQIDRIGNGRRT
jgi:hypothetical protein